MALKTTAAFLAGVSTGWVMRSAMGSSREVMVRGIVATHRGRDRLRRVVAERLEWLDDLFAEGRARYDEHSSSTRVAVDDNEAPHVVSTPRSHERAA